MFTQRMMQALYTQRQQLGHDLAGYAARREPVDAELLAETQQTIARLSAALEKLYVRCER